MRDTEWEALREVASNHGQTISSLIRERVGLLPRDGWNETPIEKVTHDFGEAAAELENSMTKAASSFNTRPFTPVPKRGR